MQRKLLLPLVLVGVCSKVSDAAAIDGRVGASSTSEARISLTIPERVEVRVGSGVSRAVKGTEQLHVRSNFEDAGLKYSLKRVIFVSKEGSAATAASRGGARSSGSRTEVFVVLPE
jgi:hypothetical protein